MNPIFNEFLNALDKGQHLKLLESGYIGDILSTVAFALFCHNADRLAYCYLTGSVKTNEFIELGVAKHLDLSLIRICMLTRDYMFDTDLK